MSSTGKKWSVVLAAAFLQMAVSGAAQAQTAAGREIAIGAGNYAERC